MAVNWIQGSVFGLVCLGFFNLVKYVIEDSLTL